MSRPFRLLPIILLLALTLAATAQAHRLKVFAYSDGEAIYVEAGFSKDSPAKAVPVVVKTADGTVITEAETDARGEAEIPIPADTTGDLTIEVNASQGHVGTWILEENEYK